jgi:hypothetical protein
MTVPALLAEASERQGDVDGVRKVPLDIFSAGAALIAAHTIPIRSPP